MTNSTILRVQAELAEEGALRSRSLADEDALAEEANELTSTLGRYITAAWRSVEPGTPFVPGWHIDAIAEHLELAYKREITRLLINIPPRHMKSLAVCVFWPTWIWTQDPTQRILNASYALNLAVRDAGKSRRLVESPWYRLRWGHLFSLTRDQNAKARYENDKTGFRLATSVGGSATGEGGDILLVDDPLKMEDAQSEAERENVLEWWGGTWATRLNDLQTGLKVVIMQRLHEQDLTGHILENEGTVDEGGEWVHLCLPAEYEPRHPFVWPDDPREEPEELLWEEKVPRRELQKLKVVMGSLVAAGQLQQRPAPAEGFIFKAKWWQFFDPENLRAPSALHFREIVQSWDTAFKEKTTSDYVVGSVWGVIGANRYLLRRVRDHLGLPETIQAIRDLHRWVELTYPGARHSILIENRANGPEVIAALRKEISGVIGRDPQIDKVARAHAVTPQFEAKNIHVPGQPLSDGSGPDPHLTPGWVVEYIAEHSSFPNGANDDQVDSTTQALLYLRDEWIKAQAKEDDDPERRHAITRGLHKRDF